MSGKKYTPLPLIKNASLTVVSQLVGFFVTLVGGILTARFLGPEGKGLIALTMTTGFLLARIICIGFDQAIPYFLASRKMRSEYILGNCLFIISFAFLVGYAVVYPLLDKFVLDSFLSGMSSSLLYLGSTTYVLYLMRLLLNALFTGAEEFPNQTWHNLMTGLMSITSGLIALVLLDFGPYGYIVVHAILGSLALSVGIFLLSKSLPLSFKFSIAKLKLFLSYGVKSMIGQIMTIIDLRLDLYVINLFASASAVGVYTVAVSIANLFYLIPNGIAIALFPRTAATTRFESQGLTAFACRNALWFSVIACGLVLLVVEDAIIFVFGDGFSSSYVALMYLIPGILGQIIGKICFNDCSANGFPEKSSISTAITAIVTISLDFWLIPKLGIRGAAIASSIAYFINGSMGIFWHLRISTNTLGSLLIPQLSDLVIYVRFFNQLKNLRIIKNYS